MLMHAACRARWTVRQHADHARRADRTADRPLVRSLGQTLPSTGLYSL